MLQAVKWEEQHRGRNRHFQCSNSLMSAPSSKLPLSTFMST
jgi:hypothetical protein